MVSAHWGKCFRRAEVVRAQRKMTEVRFGVGEVSGNDFCTASWVPAEPPPLC